MAYPHGHARVNPRHPQAFAVCDRCGRWWNKVDLKFQRDYRGKGLQNLYVLVCDPCYDTPQPQLKLFIVPPDPLPIINARLEQFSIDETSWIIAETGAIITTQSGLQFTLDPSGYEP
jgi:hypothetical protein